MDGPLRYCADITQLFEGLGEIHNSDKWRCFINSSKRSLKVVLLHIGIIKPSIPITHSIHLGESYDNIQILLNAIMH